MTFVMSHFATCHGYITYFCSRSYTDVDSFIVLIITSDVSRILSGWVHAENRIDLLINIQLMVIPQVCNNEDMSYLMYNVYESVKYIYFYITRQSIGVKTKSLIWGK